MSEALYRGRHAHQIENENLRVTVLVEGGHIAEICHKATGINPLWTPPWPSIEPSTYSLAKHPEYGVDAESKLLAGIMGHNLCVDLFGPPSTEEAAAGLTVHGEASVVPYDIESRASELAQTARLSFAGLEVRRQIRLQGSVVRVVESVRNLLPYDRPIAWTEHVTLGPPFLEKGSTQFRVTATQSRTLGGQDFLWPFVPKAEGGQEDLRVFTSAARSGGFSTHLMDESREDAWFVAWSPASRLAFGYVWRRSDFPWMGIWEENYSRQSPPWNGQTLTRGMEFGASPFAEMRRQMIERNALFGMPAYRWIPAGTEQTVRYSAFLDSAPDCPQGPPPGVRD
jgi:hypothetical protein